MVHIELPGDTTPIPPETWSGPAITEVTSALLRCDTEAALLAYDEWLLQTGASRETAIPSSDISKLLQLGRRNLAQLLIDKGLITDIAILPDLNNEPN